MPPSDYKRFLNLSGANECHVPFLSAFQDGTPALPRAR